MGTVTGATNWSPCCNQLPSCEAAAGASSPCASPSASAEGGPTAAPAIPRASWPPRREGRGAHNGTASQEVRLRTLRCVRGGGRTDAERHNRTFGSAALAARPGAPTERDAPKRSASVALTPGDARGPAGGAAAPGSEGAEEMGAGALGQPPARGAAAVAPTNAGAALAGSPTSVPAESGPPEAGAGGNGRGGCTGQAAATAVEEASTC